MPHREQDDGLKDMNMGILSRASPLFIEPMPAESQDEATGGGD